VPKVRCVGATNEQHLVGIAQDGCVHTDLGGWVAEFPREPGADLGWVQAGQPPVRAIHQLEKLLVALLVSLVACKAQALLGNSADRVQQD
jgi:hypothetical protein